MGDILAEINLTSEEKQSLRKRSFARYHQLRGIEDRDDPRDRTCAEIETLRRRATKFGVDINVHWSE